MTELRRAILRWYDQNARDLPWRRSQDPYAIWVSEIMLQQTQVATVKRYYQRFLHQFPTITALATAEQVDVLKLWEGLGYYRRARQLHAAAQVVRDRHAGQFPHSIVEVLALPGIGRYTAGAILSIAFDQRLPILEGNTIRVYSRLLGYRDDPRSSQGQRTLWQFAEEILPNRRSGALNQAMMDLGSEICVPRDPDCDACPLHRMCPTRERGWQAEIPAAARKTNYEELNETAVMVSRNGKWLIRKCGDDERWAGLWDFPRFKAHHSTKSTLKQNERAIAEEVAKLTGVRVVVGSPRTTIKHAVTRYRITLTCYDAEFCSGRVRANANCRWVTAKQLADYPLSVTGRKLANLAVVRTQ